MKRFVILVGLVLSSSFVLADDLNTVTPLPKHNLPASKDGSLVIGNCDGQSSVEIKGKKEGEKLSSTEAQAVANQLMQQWQQKNPDTKWVVAQADTAGQLKAEADQREKGSDLGQAAPNKQKGPSFDKTPKSDPFTAVSNKEKNSKEVTRQAGVYSDYTKADQAMWEQEQNRMIKMGDEAFHNSDKLGSKTGMACAMCHPNGSNTHAETYPKFQVQLQRVVMLRDMINWCLENPVKAPLLKDDDPLMHALEAYIISTRKGVALAPGKH